MEPVDFLRLAFSLAVLIFVVGVVRQITGYMRGAIRPVSIAGLAKVPRRYLGDLHHKVDRDRYASVMHVAVAGGFVATLGFLMFSLVWPTAEFLYLGGLLFSLVMVLGAGMAIWRRVMKRADYPASRSKGQWQLFGFVLVVAAASLVGWFVTEGKDWGTTLIVAIGLTYLAASVLWRSPMWHAVAGLLNLALHPRPERFRDCVGHATALRPLDLSAAPLGHAAAADMDWTRLLNFDACVECGRCETACPAFAAGQPLNPKALVQDILQSAGLNSMAGPYGGNGHPVPSTNASAPLAGSPEEVINSSTLWSCTTCRACVEECPMFIEHVDTIVDFRRYEVLEKGAIPGLGASVLNSYAVADTPSGKDPARRFDWAAGLDLPLICETGQADLLLWAGEAGFDARGQRTLRAVVSLLRHAGLEPAVLGSEERDCGDLARRMGDEVTFQRLARYNIETLNRYRIGSIVTTDPHVLHVFKEEYPEFGTPPPVRHHSQILADLVAGQQLGNLTKMAEKITFHDPCYLGRWSGEYEAPRRLLEEIAVEVVEMDRSRHRSRCCGGGGGAPVTDIPGDRRIPDMRIRDVEASGSAAVAVACPNCAVMLEGVSDRSAEVHDIAEILARCANVES